jgi:hypothetical protein
MQMVFTMAAGLCSAVILRSESRGTDDHILLSQIRDSPNLEGQIPVFISPTKRMARLYPWRGAHRKHVFLYYMFCHCRGNNVSTELFLSNGCCTVACLHSCYLAMGVTCHNIKKDAHAMTKFCALYFSLLFVLETCLRNKDCPIWKNVNTCPSG